MAPLDLLAPYCGPPPVPATWLGRWNLDPLLIATWTGVAIGWRLLLAYRAGTTASRRRSFAAGWAVALAAWISPLCALGVALFSARVAQHALLVLVAAPLLARGWPGSGDRSLRLREAATAWASLTAATWLWHAPGPYQLTFQSDVAYWVMHASLLASAIAVWRVLFARGRGLPLASGVALASCFQMSALGALLAFAPAPLFAPHAATTAAFGLSALEDQQLGGLLLWVPGCLVFLAAGLAPVAALLKAQDGPARRAVS